MSKNVCPHCGEKVTVWKKFQLTDKKFPRYCNSCEKRIMFPAWYVKFSYIFNIAAAVFLVLVTLGMGDNRTISLVVGALALAILNLFMVKFIPILKGE